MTLAYQEKERNHGPNLKETVNPNVSLVASEDRNISPTFYHIKLSKCFLGDHEELWRYVSPNLYHAICLKAFSGWQTKTLDQIYIVQMFHR